MRPDKCDTEQLMICLMFCLRVSWLTLVHLALERTACASILHVPDRAWYLISVPCHSLGLQYQVVSGVMLMHSPIHGTCLFLRTFSTTG